MAKKKATKAAGKAPTENELLELLRKAHAGELPTVHRAVLAAGYSSGPKWVVGSTDEVGAFLGISERRVQQLVKQGLPRTQLAGKPIRFVYDLRAIVAWRLEATAATDKSTSESSGLERLRVARARREELALNRDLKTVISREQVEATYAAAAVVLRRYGDLVQRQFGRVAWELWDEHLDEAERAIEERLNVV